VSGEAILSAENSEKSLGGHDSAPNPAGELTALPRPPSWWGLLPPSHPQELYPALSLRSRFLALQASFGSLSQQSSFPQCVGVLTLDKNTGSDHFRSQRMHQNAGFCIKITHKNFLWSRPRTRAAGGETFVCTHSGVNPPNVGALRFF